MGNIIESFFSGVGKVIGKLFGSPFDFLSGKSCSSVCGSTWDFICYIENFCIANLLKLAMVSVLFYIVFLFLYISYKLGVCQCICRTLCKMVWACFATCFYGCKYCCICLCSKLRMLRRTHQYRRRQRHIEMLDTNHVARQRHMEDRRRSRRDYKGDHLRRSLRPRSHRIRVGINGDSVYMNKRNPIKHGNLHDIRMIRTSKFVQKGPNYKGMISRRR